MSAIETTATIKENNQLILDTPVPNNYRGKVRLLILLPDKNDFDENEWLRAASVNPTFAFLSAPEEETYSDEDGKPFQL